MSASEPDPLFGDIPDRIELARAPIVYVVAQVQFTPILRIREQTFVVGFQDRIRKVYPFVNRVEVHTLPLPGQPQDGNTTEVHWNFDSADKRWRVVLTPSGIALETKNYHGHIDFIERFISITKALEESISPSVALRIGYRYVNRLDKPEDLEDIQNLVRENLIGMAGENIRNNVIQSIAQSNCETKEGALTVHWGILPPNTSVSEMMERVETKSWLLDVDAYTAYEGGEVFDVDSISKNLTSLSNRAYAFFRWAFTDKLIERFG